MYNVFGWLKKSNGFRRINTVYDKRAKKNGKTAEMAGMALYGMSFDLEMEAEIYVGATKEEQARLCWEQAKMFIESPVANPMLKKMGFYTMQRIIGFRKTNAKMRALGGDSKTQDGINCHIGIIDEYHAHKDDTVLAIQLTTVLKFLGTRWHDATVVPVQLYRRQIAARRKLIMNDVRQRYGTPQTERKEAWGEILTYGRFRVVGGKEGAAEIVLFPPFKK